ncbi:MAG: hypothetical protein ACOYMN_14410 [Roseimicrobium sp.]
MNSSLSRFALAALLIGFMHTPSQAEDTPIKIDKSTADKAKDMLEKLVGEVKSAADKAGDKGRELWERTKENLRLSREEYLKKVTSALTTMDAEIQVLAESGSSVTARDYFKTRLESLRQQLDYCKRDLDRLAAADSEEAFRVKQKGFDRGLGFLGDQIELAQEEAGL